MKSKINALLASDRGLLEINDYCRLSRWQVVPFVGKTDRLVVEFSLTHACSHIYEIHSRDWRGIAEEVKEAQIKAFAEAAEELNKQLANGYIK